MIICALIKQQHLDGTRSFATFVEYKDDNKHGKGTYTYNSGPNKGDVYVGEYKDDKMHGKGTYTWNSGSNKGNVYDGEYKDDKKHGNGTFTWADGDVYVGEYKDGKRHGKGTYTYDSGNVYDVEKASRNGIIYPSLDPSIFEVKYPNQDILGKVVGDI